MGRLLPANNEHAPRLPAPAIEPPVEQTQQPDKVRAGYYALVRNAAAVTESERVSIVPTAAPDAQAMLTEFAYTTDAACLLRADVNLPPDLYAFVDALMGVSGGNTDLFSATDAQIAKRAGRSVKWVQRSRNELTNWQSRENFNLIDVEDHYTDRERKRHPHKYRVHLHRLAVETKLAAETDHKWVDERRRGFALQAAARRTRDSIPEWAPRKSRGQKQEPTAEAVINRNVKTAATLLKKVNTQLRGAELRRQAHGWQTAPPVDGEGIVELLAQVDELRALIAEREQSEGTASGHAISVVDKMSTRDFIGEECAAASKGDSTPFISADETFIPAGTPDEIYAELYGATEQHGG